MKAVISASRRTDLVAFFPDWLASVLRQKSARVLAPRGRVRSVDLDPRAVHTIVMWSKNFRNLIRNKAGLQELLAAYDQIYLHFTVTGLGGMPVEAGAPPPQEALGQLPALVKIAGRPERISLRFDPILFWRDGGAVRSNLTFFEEIATAAASCGVQDIRTSFAQWYRKARARASARGFDFVDPSDREKRDRAGELAAEAAKRGLRFFACSQPLLGNVEGVRPSSCIDGRLLESLHPGREPVSHRKDASQRAGCLCTESVDIGSYKQSCPHGCIYCYANPAA
jgi:DNA repair photolyase